MLLDTATADIVGIATEYGPAKMRQPDTGSLYHTVRSHLSFAVSADLLSGYTGGLPQAERRAYRDEPVIVLWYDHETGPAVRDVVRFETEGDRIGRIRFHFFSPDVLADICSELGLPWRSNGYRYWSSEVARSG